MDRDYTGNAYVFVPCIDREDGSIHAINVVHRGLDGLIEWRSAPFPEYGPEALLRPFFRIDGEEAGFRDAAWQRHDGWIPHVEAGLGSDVRVAITYCAPPGTEAYARGLILRIVLDNRGTTPRRVEMGLAGRWRATTRCVATSRPMHAPNRLIAGPGGEVALECGDGPLGAALAVVASGRETRLQFDGAPAVPGREMEARQGEPLAFGLHRDIELGARKRITLSFAIAAGPERDGAWYTARGLAGKDAGRIVQDARLEATRLGRHGGPRGVAEMARRNLVFAASTGTARAIDDDRLYPVASRFLEHGPCGVVDELDVLTGTLPALVLVDPFSARELLLRMFELYSDRAGIHLRYLSGGVLSPAFSLARLCAYAEALDRYVTGASDPALAAEPIVQDVLREMDDWLWGKLHRDTFLCATDVGPSGEPTEYAFSTIDNVHAWRFAKILGQYWQPRDDEPPSRFREAADDFAAALWQHCVVEHEGTTLFAGSTDLEGSAAIYDDPEGSLRWLPYLGFCATDDPIWTDTLELLHSPAYPLWRTDGVAEGLAGRESGGLAGFAAVCAQLTTPQRERAIATLRRLELPGGIACRRYDTATGACAAGAWSAAHAGLLAWTLLYDSSPPTRAKKR